MNLEDIKTVQKIASQAMSLINKYSPEPDDEEDWESDDSDDDYYDSEDIDYDDE